MAKGRTWTFEALIASSAKLADWRGSAKNYASSTKRIYDGTIPYVGTGALLFQFSHWGMTEDKKIHRVHLLFYGLTFLKGGQSPSDLDATEEDFMNVEYDGKVYRVEKPSIRAPLKVRCTCSDAFFRWNWYNWEHGAIFGVKPRAYKRKTTTAPPVNPGHLPGICKHTVNSMFALESGGATRPGTKAIRSINF
jgi:hypothetical protein